MVLIEDTVFWVTFAVWISELVWFGTMDANSTVRDDAPFDFVLVACLHHRGHTFASWLELFVSPSVMDGLGAMHHIG